MDAVGGLPGVGGCLAGCRERAARGDAAPSGGGAGRGGFAPRSVRERCPGCREGRFAPRRVRERCPGCRKGRFAHGGSAKGARGAGRAVLHTEEAICRPVGRQVEAKHRDLSGYRATGRQEKDPGLPDGSRRGQEGCAQGGGRRMEVNKKKMTAGEMLLQSSS